MIRHVAAAAVICLLPSWVGAQSTEFTVNAASANVHKSPSTGSPVIGQASRGQVLTVTRELGSWVRVSWPAAADGVGYLHVNTGWLAKIVAPGSRPAPASSASALSAQAPQTASPAPIAASVASPSAQAARTTTIAPSQTLPTAGLAPTAHRIGLGGRLGGSSLGVGASARTAVGPKMTVQLELSRYSPTDATTLERLTSVQFAPSILYSLPDTLSDYVWIRPYVGTGITIYNSTLGSTLGSTVGSVSETSAGPQVFGGTEVIFAAVPRFSLSADYGYRWPQTPFPGYELGGTAFAISGHWYVK